MLKYFVWYIGCLSIFLLWTAWVFFQKIDWNVYWDIFLVVYMILLLFLFEWIFEYVKRVFQVKEKFSFDIVAEYVLKYRHILYHGGFFLLFLLYGWNIPFFFVIVYVVLSVFFYQIPSLFLFIAAWWLWALFPLVWSTGYNTLFLQNVMTLFLITWLLKKLFEVYGIGYYNPLIFLKWQGIKDVKENFFLLFHVILFVYFGILIWSFSFEILRHFLYLNFWVLLIAYIFFKILGYKIDFSLQKMSLKNTENWNYLIIFLSGFLIVWGNMFSEIWQFVLAFLLFFWVFLGLYSDIFTVIKKYIFRNIRFVLTVSTIGIFLSIYYGFPILKDVFSPEKKAEHIIDQWLQDLLLLWEDVWDETFFIPEIPSFSELDFDQNLALNSQWEKVVILQKFLNFYGFYNFGFSGIYDEKTQIGMQRFLYEKCDWNQNNQWILWPLWRECILNFLYTQNQEQ